ncbi:MAG: hydrogenase formation protein HypD [Candidatus Omnitrophota bacterium]|nr:hydrogenase formation protein HypD [Candidatus Omnitrophota bacterium]
MRYVDEFRNQKLVQKVAQEIKRIAPKNRPINLMEVCGTHTQGFFRFGLKDLIPDSVHLLSGPGCPVCVSGQDYMDQAIELSQRKNVIIATFGDMMRVPGNSSSLEKERSKGAKVWVVYSTLDALRVAEDNPTKRIVFLGVGFETTSPTIAIAIKEARKKDLGNFSVLVSHKLIPPAMKVISQDKKLNIQGFLCPGHVSAIIGSEPYEFIAKKYRLPCVIAGFEPLDILEGIYMLLRQIKDKKSKVEIQYKRIVKPQGNPQARRILKEVFAVCDSNWRGLGIIPQSGLKIRGKYAQFDAQKVFKLKTALSKETRGCICGLVLKGIKKPDDCHNFAVICTPENPLGPCMVASEGTCSIYYKYRK